jgi:DNA (cytosine-5)-methyltransferase 1
MEYASLFTGIGGFDLGFDRAGMECVAHAEIDPFASKVLAARFPGAKNYGDVRNVTKETAGTTIDLVCGGFPCTDVSVAGKRAGLAGKRSGEWYQFHRTIEELRPRWVVIENVPGLLSSCGCIECQAVRRIMRIHSYLRNKRKIDVKCAICDAGERMLKSHRGRDLAVILHGLEELGYGWGYRIFDAQYFGVAQRRRRVFIVGYLGGGGNPAKVLFESESLQRHTPPSRETGEGVTGCLAARAGKDGAGANGQVDKLVPGVYQWSSGGGDDIKDTAQSLRSQAEHSYQIAITPVPDPAYAIQGVGSKFGSGRHNQSLTVGSGDKTVIASAFDVRNMKEDGEVASTLQAKETGGQSLNFQPVIAFTAREDGRDATEEVTPTMRSISKTDHQAGGHGLAVAWHNRQQSGEVRIQEDGLSPTLLKYLGTGGNNVPFVGIRRLMPVECERLQAFPDGWTDVEEMSDTQRYKQLGNAVCVSVAEWLATRIMMVERGEL